MKELLEKIFEQRSNGLYFVNTPTGSAKSYSAVQFIRIPLNRNSFYVFKRYI